MHSHMRHKFLIFSLVLAGCAANPETGTKQLSSDQAASFAASSYAKAVPGVSLNEARRRMAVMTQSRSIYTCARQQEGYAGLVIVHSPEFEIRAYFKGDAAQKLLQCTNDSNFKTRETQASLVDFNREKDVAETALSEAGIEPFIVIKPYGHLDNQTPPYSDNFITTDGHVLVSVQKEDVNRANSVLAPFALKNVYVREESYDEIVLTSFTK